MTVMTGLNFFFMQFTDQNFETEVLKSETPVLVDFFAVWCGPCQALSPIIKEFAEEFKSKPIKIGKLDVDQSPQTANKYNIMSVPTLIIFKNGKPVETMTGLQSKEVLTEKLEKLIEK